MSDLSRLAPSHVRAIAPYQPGKPIGELARELDLDPAGIVKLASNENPQGLSPRVKAALVAALDDIARYPDGNSFDVKAAVCRRFGSVPEQIVLGNGSNDLLELVARTFLSPDDSVVFAQYSFAVYPLVTQACGATCIEVPARDFGHDLAAMCASIRADTKLVFVANPNNPTGTFVPGAELLAFLESVPENVLVMLDEAYTEFLPEADRYDSLSWLGRFPNLIVSRTLSKAYGLAGLRVGVAFANPVVADLINRIRQPFNVNSLAQAAACAALEDEAFLRQTVDGNTRGLRQLGQAFERLGISYIPSRGNFITFHCEDAAGINRALLQQGVIVRPLASYGLHHSLRVSVGTEAENARFITALEHVLA
ncbi:histidinol-phosphate transaminase [Laribacter hongkongensis]|uniref:histidinol-phosphate transaminase n=2 Tax=Laribacter hongkongensis TaxID=168471 RepID=UPI001EFDE651|nr:histidinol-phosphate transaminase [Laribacter hongkongensis]MCG8992434.1 histidinol-phosphate transaminase [Laribacter hongkongensis]MCG8998033.1 histidinol-phosphate transaminase [Laribacter hongkongensis]MCG8999904.1 histidinol-phosphate transaminase [Laribacter hongkongensis]MCG9004267.1 histidinol-phosphate transaminase [Laribacter hongkongensis]MCG9007125.1 histidinol-phosphate transaminase [Laribacter hongkongensis]